MYDFSGAGYKWKQPKFRHVLDIRMSVQIARLGIIAQGTWLGGLWRWAIEELVIGVACCSGYKLRSNHLFPELISLYGSLVAS